MIRLTTEMGREVGNMNVTKKKISLTTYINFFDSLSKSLATIRVVNEVQLLVEKWYCYCLSAKNLMQNLNELIKSNDIEVALDKIKKYMSENSREDKRKINEVNDTLNALAEKYDLYKFIDE